MGIVSLWGLSKIGVPIHPLNWTLDAGGWVLGKGLSALGSGLEKAGVPIVTLDELPPRQDAFHRVMFPEGLVADKYTKDFLAATGFGDPDGPLYDNRRSQCQAHPQLFYNALKAARDDHGNPIDPNRLFSKVAVNHNETRMLIEARSGAVTLPGSTTPLQNAHGKDFQGTISIGVHLMTGDEVGKDGQRGDVIATREDGKMKLAPEGKGEGARRLAYGILLTRQVIPGNKWLTVNPEKLTEWLKKTLESGGDKFFPLDNMVTPGSKDDFTIHLDNAQRFVEERMRSSVGASVPRVTPVATGLHRALCPLTSVSRQCAMDIHQRGWRTADGALRCSPRDPGSRHELSNRRLGMVSWAKSLPAISRAVAFVSAFS